MAGQGVPDVPVMSLSARSYRLNEIPRNKYGFASMLDIRAGPDVPLSRFDLWSLV